VTLTVVARAFALFSTLSLACGARAKDLQEMTVLDDCPAVVGDYGDPVTGFLVARTPAAPRKRTKWVCRPTVTWPGSCARPR